MPKGSRSGRTDKNQKQRGASNRESDSRRGASQVRESGMAERRAGQLEREERTGSSRMGEESRSRL